MSEYTKCPWFYRPDSSSNESGHPAGDFMVGNCSDRPDNVAVCTGVGDAALIAAAPDLLEALESVLDSLGALTKQHELLGHMDEVEANKVWAALHKATGRPMP